MHHDDLSAATQTILQLDDYFQSLQCQALAIYDPHKVAARGYITPSQELQIRQLQVSYWKARSALLELVSEVQHDAKRPELATPHQFLVALAGAALLVDAARFLRETFHQAVVVRRKLDEPDPIYDIPPRMYDNIQRSLVSVHHAWHLWQATRYYDRNRSHLLEAVADDSLAPLIGIIDRLRDRLRPSLWMFLRTRLRVRGRRAVRRIGRDVLGRALYAVQESLGGRMANVFVRPGHMPHLPPTVRAQVANVVEPGDVLVVRKEFAVTNYFLPGHWPHVALVIGTRDDLHKLGIADHPHVRARLSHFPAPAAPSVADAGVASPLVLEAMKDGVRLRSLDSPLASDSVVILRPRLQASQIGTALAQALMHEGKPYDFDFDFCSSHRLVCTEVVYRAYDGIGEMRFELSKHVGRFALATGELLRMGLAEQYFEVLAVYSPAHSSVLEFGAPACEIVGKVEGAHRIAI